MSKSFFTIFSWPLILIGISNSIGSTFLSSSDQSVRISLWYSVDSPVSESLNSNILIFALIQLWGDCASTVNLSLVIFLTASSFKLSFK